MGLIVVFLVVKSLQELIDMHLLLDLIHSPVILHQVG